MAKNAKRRGQSRATAKGRKAKAHVKARRQKRVAKKQAKRASVPAKRATSDEALGTAQEPSEVLDRNTAPAEDSGDVDELNDEEINSESLGDDE